MADRAGRFTVKDVDLAMTVVARAALVSDSSCTTKPKRDDAEATDQVTDDLVRMLGLAADEAHEICTRPCPTSTAPPKGGTAA